MTEPPWLQRRLRVAVEFEKSPPTIDGPAGIRRVLRVACGTFVAGEVIGMVVPGSGDWVLERRDGSLELDICFTLAPNDGAPVNPGGRSCPRGRVLLPHIGPIGDG